MLKKIIFIFIILCSLKFYELSLIPDVVIKLTEWIGISLTLLLLLIYIVYGKEKQLKKHFLLPVILIFISVFISMIGSYIFQDQSFAATAYAQRVIYFYFVYFLLHYLKLPTDFFIKSILALAIVYIGIYIAQYVIYPVQITKSKMFIDRGTLRIFISGAGYLVIGYFIWLYLTFRSFKFKYVMYLLVSLGVFVLLGTRQVIASMVLLTILFILQSRVVKSKLFIFLLIGISIIPVYYLFQDIILSMFEVTQKQSQNVEGNVRVESAKFFLTEFMPSAFAYFTGNGANGPSLYGLRVVRYSEEYGFYQSDIGLIGEYTKYGVLFVVGVIIILIRTLKPKIPEKLMFIKYNFLGIILTLVTGGGSFGGSGTNIVIICMMLYVLDIYFNKEESLMNIT